MNPNITPGNVATWKFKQSKYDHVPSLPTRMLVVGASGSGKGVWLSSTILDTYRNCFDAVHVWSPTVLVDSQWDAVKRYISTFQEEDGFHEDFNPDEIELLVDTQKKIIQEQKRRNMKRLFQMLIVIDDFGSDDSIMRGKAGEILKVLYTKGRHFGISVICSVQKYRMASTVLRSQATGLVIFRSRSQVDLDAILEENSALLPGGKKSLFKIYMKAVEEPYSFMVIDLMQKDPKKIFTLKHDSYLWVK